MLRDEVLAGRRKQPHVLEPKCVHSGFGLLQLLVVVPDLLVEELAGAVGAGAAFAQALLDEDRNGGLHHVTRLLGFGVAKRDRVQILAEDRARDLQRSAGIVDEGLGRLARARVEIGLADDLLDVGPAEKRAAQNRRLLAGVREYGHPGHQRPQHRLRIDIDARRRFVLVRQAEHPDCTDDHHDPGDGQPEPATLPHAPQVVDESARSAVAFDAPRNVRKPAALAARTLRTSFAGSAECRRA